MTQLEHQVPRRSIILKDFEVRNALKNEVIQIRRPINPSPYLPCAT